MPSKIRLFGEIFFLDILFDFLKNNTDKNYVVKGVYHVKRMFKIKKFFNDSNLIYFKSILYKIINSQYIMIENKKRLKKDFEAFFSTFNL